MDHLTKEQRHKNMAANRGKGTKLELQIGKMLWNAGVRYRKNDKSEFGKADFVNKRYKIAIFCDSEFFHGKDWEVLKPRLEKGVHGDFWVKKITNNRRRDDEVNKQLLFMGWIVIRFWGKEIMKNTDECVRVIEETVFDIKMEVND